MEKITAKFRIGQVVITPAVKAEVPVEEALQGLMRHANCDYGDMPEEDKETNQAALEHGGRIMSAYTTANGTKFWIITEADRSVTTILLPEDY